jgi:hypothetical protein
MTDDRPWPPRVGEPLPRAADGYAEPGKLTWIVSEEGHGREWTRVLHIGPDDTLRLWNAIARAAIGAPSFRVAERHGVTCGANIELQIGPRQTKATTSWHYQQANDAPRLVTAYPIR